MASPELRTLNLGDLHESPMNVRRSYDTTADAELVASIQQHGILTPILARPNAKGFEIGAGHRRYRAAKAAGLITVPVLVREMDDQAFFELLLTENLQRQDVSPLEEAEGFKALTKKFGIDIDTVAKRIGRTRRYIFDRMRLLELIGPAKQLVARGVIPTRHAELLARLTKEQQGKAIAVSRRGGGYGPIEGPLFTEDDRGLLEIAELQARRANDPYVGMKVRSVAEFEGWIAEHCRFEPAAPVNAELYPETVVAVEQAEKVVHITDVHFVQPDAKVDGERTYGPQSWKRADGKDKSKPCAFSVTGVGVVGRLRGQAFKVCINKDKCDVHWGAERRAKAKAEKNPTAKKALERKESNARQREAEQRQRDEQERAAFTKAMPAILEAVAQKVRSLPIAHVVDETYRTLYGGSEIRRVLGYPMKGSLSADQLVRIQLMIALNEDCSPYNRASFIRDAKERLGLDVAAIVKAATATEKAPAGKEAPLARGKRR